MSFQVLETLPCWWRKRHRSDATKVQIPRSGARKGADDAAASSSRGSARRTWMDHCSGRSRYTAAKRGTLTSGAERRVPWPPTHAPKKSHRRQQPPRAAQWLALNQRVSGNLSVTSHGHHGASVSKSPRLRGLTVSSGASVERRRQDAQRVGSGQSAKKESLRGGEGRTA